jgi:exodeoxyribonuclease VII large subunit
MRLARPTPVLRAHGHRLALLEHRLLGASRQAASVRATRLALLASRLQRCVSAMQAGRAERLRSLQARLSTLDPRRVLSRGYAWLADAHGHPVQSIEQLSLGQSLDAVLVDGSAKVTVNAVHRLPPK